MERAGRVAPGPAGARARRVRRAGCRELPASRAAGRQSRRYGVTAYIIRRVLYAIPILIGVNVLTFLLFFTVNTPDDMARMHLGLKRVTPEAIAKWKHERGYDKPIVFNGAAAGIGEKFTDTIFFEKSLRM